MLKYMLKSTLSIYEITQILGVSVFDERYTHDIVQE